MGGVVPRCLCVQKPRQVAVDPLIQILHLSLKSMLTWLYPPPFGDMRLVLVL